MTRLSFPLQLVAVIVVSALTALGSVYAMRDRLTADQQRLGLDQAKIASDVRDILTRMDAAAKLADERADAMKESITTLQREQRLLDLNIRAVNEALIILKGKAK